MEKKKIYYGWWIVLGCILITCTMVPLIMALSNKFLIQITTDMGISRSSFTLNNTIIQALGVLLSPLIAKKLVKGNQKVIQSISIIGFVIAYASYGLAQDVIHLYISSFFVGIFYLSSTLIPITMMITNWFTKKRGMAMSLAMAGIGLGGFIFSPFISFMLIDFGWRTTYIVMALIVLIVALPMSLFVFKKKPEDVGLKAYGADEVLDKKGKEISFASISLSVKESRKKLFFFILLAGMLLNGIVNAGALGQFPPALEELHGVALQATIISLYSIIGIVGKLLLGWINDRWGVIASSVFGCGMFALAFTFMLFSSEVTFAYAMAVAFGLGMAIGTVSPPLITAAIYGPEKYGEAYGIVNSASQIGLAVGSLIVAGIFDATGSYQTAWILLLVLTLFTLFSWIFAYVKSRAYCKIEKKTI